MFSTLDLALSPRRYLFLDGLRGLAVLWVLIDHIQGLQPASDVPGVQAVGFFGRPGYMGVDIFFVISGFLITGLLFDPRKPLDVTVQSARLFYVRRAFKILPQYLAVVLAVALLERWSAFSELLQTPFYDEEHAPWTAMLFAQNYIGYPNLALHHTWSLAVEEHFYLVYPLILFGATQAFIRIGFFRGQMRRQMLALAGLLIMLALCVLELRLRMGLQSLDELNAQHTHFRADGLAWGCLLKLTEPGIEWLSRLRCRQLLSYAGCVVGLGLIVLEAAPSETQVITLPQSIATLYVHPFFFSLAPLGAAMIMGAMLLSGQLARLLEGAWLMFVGRMSYGLYIWHYVVLFALLPIVIGWNALAATVLFLALAFLCGWGSTVTLERYFLNLRSQLTSTARQKLSAEPGVPSGAQTA